MLIGYDFKQLLNKENKSNTLRNWKCNPTTCLHYHEDKKFTFIMSLTCNEIRPKRINVTSKTFYPQFIEKSRYKATKSCIIMIIMMDYKIQPLAVVENLRTYTKTHTFIHKKNFLQH